MRSDRSPCRLLHRHAPVVPTEGKGLISSPSSVVLGATRGVRLLLEQPQHAPLAHCPHAATVPKRLPWAPSRTSASHDQSRYQRAALRRYLPRSPATEERG